MALATTEYLHIKLAKGLILNRKRQAATRYKYGQYFVPPPPAYMPSLLPELKAAYISQSTEAEKPANPYKKYIYSLKDNLDPIPIETRKGVTIWAKPITSP